MAGWHETSFGDLSIFKMHKFSTDLSVLPASRLERTSAIFDCTFWSLNFDHASDVVSKSESYICWDFRIVKTRGCQLIKTYFSRSYTYKFYKSRHQICLGQRIFAGRNEDQNKSDFRSWLLEFLIDIYDCGVKRLHIVCYVTQLSLYHSRFNINDSQNV